MCGIAGIVAFDPNILINSDRLDQMRDTIAHRGPDGAGSWIEGPAGLAHRRLAIVDLAGGHQPMPNHDRSFWITFNGEIYNHPLLKSELEQTGHRYYSRSDTETILHLYEKYGEECVEHLQGMFAFAIWDKRKKRLFAARDRLGIKPFYYHENNRELLFASEIKSILTALPGRPELNRSILPEYLATRYTTGDETFFEGIRKLLPGHTLSWSAAQGLRIRRYWSLPEVESSFDGSFADCAEDLRGRLHEVVGQHLMSDVPLGLFLSGGIDSSGLAALTAPQIEGRLNTFSVGFTAEQANELPWARLAAESIGAQHHEIVVSPADFFQVLPRLVWQEDEPIAFTSSIPLYFVSSLAQEHVKVVLTGEGADELFLGYNRYRITAWNERLGRAWKLMAPGSLQRAMSRAIAAGADPLSRKAQRTFLAVEPNPRSLFFENFSVVPAVWRERLLADPRLRTLDPFAIGLERYISTRGDQLRRMSSVEIQGYLVELLMKQDQMSMAASIESRVPFLDHKLVEHVFSLPSSFKLRGPKTKAVLRRALADLVPQKILRRPKMGFPVPLGDWLRGEFSGLVNDLLLGERARQRTILNPEAVRAMVKEHQGGINHTESIWLLINLELWQRIFLDGEDPHAFQWTAR